MNLGARIINPTTARYDDEDDIGCSDRPARHVPAFDFFFRPYSLPRARPLSQSARSHTFQLHIRPVPQPREWALPVPSHRKRSRTRTVDYTSQCCPSLQRSAFAYSFSFSLQCRIIDRFSSLSLSSSDSFRWMTLSLRDRERGKY